MPVTLLALVGGTDCLIDHENLLIQPGLLNLQAGRPQLLNILNHNQAHLILE